MTLMTKDDPISTQTIPGSSSVQSKKRRHLAEPSHQSQSTIQDLFSTTNEKSSDHSSTQLKTTPYTTPKRARFSLTSQPASSLLPATKMYSFPSRKPPPEVIDLTDTPSPPPARRLAMASIVQPQVGAKRLVVKNQRPSKSNTKLYYQQISTKLDRALDVILGGNDTAALSMEDLYQGVKNVCKQGYAADLSKRLTTRMRAHAKETVRERLIEAIGSDTVSERSLSIVLDQWALWKEQWAIIRSIYFFMDTPPQVSLADLTVELFLEGVMKDETISRSVKASACMPISRERHGERSDLTLSHDAVQMCTSLGLYSDDLEPLLLSESQAFVAEWAAKSSVAKDLPSYIQAINSLFDSEIKRCDQLGLSSHTKTRLIEILEKGAIDRYVDRLVNRDDVAGLLDEDAESSIANLYSLLARRKLTDKLKNPFEVWIRKIGTEIIFDEKREDEMVVRLLSLYKQLDRTHINAFQRDRSFAYSLRDTFEEIMNKTKKTAATHNTDNTKQGEMIAKYVDLLLRGGHKVIPASAKKGSTADETADDEENDLDDQDAIMNDQLDQVLDLFRFLHGKAVFEAFYKKDLARRLLMGRSASADAELSMLTRLKNECGDGFTHNLETMFKDIELSKEEMLEHRQRLDNSTASSDVDLSVMILSKAAWPSYPDIKVNIPKDVQSTLNRFEGSYNTHHSGRVLEWKHGLAHCVVSAQFTKKKELVVSGFQAIVLLLFNKDDVLSYERILAETGLRKSPWTKEMYTCRLTFSSGG
jgi:cullin 4